MLNGFQDHFFIIETFCALNFIFAHPLHHLQLPQPKVIIVLFGQKMFQVLNESHHFLPKFLPFQDPDALKHHHHNRVHIRHNKVHRLIKSIQFQWQYSPSSIPRVHCSYHIEHFIPLACLPLLNNPINILSELIKYSHLHSIELIKYQLHSTLKSLVEISSHFFDVHFTRTVDHDGLNPT